MLCPVSIDECRMGAAKERCTIFRVFLPGLNPVHDP